MGNDRYLKTKFGGVALPFTPPLGLYFITYQLDAIVLTNPAAISFCRYTTFSLSLYMVYIFPTVKLHIRAYEQICYIIHP
jgi:hypothetical protein